MPQITMEIKLQIRVCGAGPDGGVIYGPYDDVRVDPDGNYEVRIDKNWFTPDFKNGNQYHPFTEVKHIFVEVYRPFGL